MQDRTHRHLGVESAVPPLSGTVTVSVVIPVRNAAATLGEQLDALAGQRLEVPWEVVIADNGSTDETVAVARSRAGALPGLRVVHANDQAGSAYARNVGAAAARGELLIFLDADDVVAPGYLASLTSALRRHQFVAARVDHVRLAPGGRPTRDPWQSQGLMTGDFLPCAASSTMGVRATAFRAVGGFDVGFVHGHDDDLSWRLQLAGYPLVYVPEAVVAYRSRVDPAQQFRQERKWGVFDVRAYRKFRAYGMRRDLRAALVAWARALWRLAHARTRAELSFALGLLGRRLGRLQGSLSYRTFYP